MQQYFDQIYILNLRHRTDRKGQTQEKLNKFGLNVEWFPAYDGRILGPIWYSHQRAFSNSHFKNPNYLACAMSHLAIYKTALDRGQERILILEDDNAFFHQLNEAWKIIEPSIPQNWEELLYLGWIPLEDDMSRWNYQVIKDKFIDKHVLQAHNMWGLYAYGIHKNLMQELLTQYHEKGYPMELDRFFVNHIQPRKKSFAITPQLFAATDGISDNSGLNESGMLMKSVHKIYANVGDYI